MSFRIWSHLTAGCEASRRGTGVPEDHASREIKLTTFALVPPHNRQSSDAATLGQPHHMASTRVMSTHFFGCYLVTSKMPGSKAAYVGFTTNPLRRIRQHNQEIKGGARATKHMGKGQCEMSLIVYVRICSFTIPFLKIVPGTSRPSS